jgi:ABC-2 type transport system permease protein
VSTAEALVTAAVQVLTLARRSILRLVRQPAELIPTLTFPLIFLALLSGGAQSAADVPGFPAPSYLDFALAGVMVQGALLGGIGAGASLAMDIESGFLRRLSLTPMHKPALLVGHLAGSMAIGLIQGLVFIAVGRIFGVEIAAGWGGAALLVALVMLVSLAFSAVGSVIAIRTRSSEAVQSVFPLFFIILSFSSFFIPRELMPVDWFRAIANANPASYIIEAGRSLVVVGWDAGMIATGFAAAAGIALVAIAGATRGLRTLLARA